MVPVTYTDGPYHNFPDTQKNCDGVWFVKAKGHTNGNSLVMDLNHPVPTVLAEVDFSQLKASGKYVCSICGYVYVPAEHDGATLVSSSWKVVCSCRKTKSPFESWGYR